MFPFHRTCFAFTLLAVLAGLWVEGAYADTKTRNASAAAKGDDGMTVDDEGLQLGNAMVIEGKVEKPQVQFPLLREPPPEREITFEESFLQNILELDRENVPDPQGG